MSLVERIATRRLGSSLELRGHVIVKCRLDALLGCLGRYSELGRKRITSSLKGTLGGRARLSGQ